MSQSDMNRTALVLGATGAVGKQLLKDVLVNGKYSRVVTVGRRPVELGDDIPQDKLERKTVDFDNLEKHRKDFQNVSDVFCCLGTTRRDAGGAENFVKIDQDYVLNSAKIIAEENKPTGAGEKLSPVHFLYCSSIGANKDSFFLYTKTKGETEAKLAETGFERVSIFRPGFLKTVEPRSRPRLMESVAVSIVDPINRFFNLQQLVSVETVGKAIHRVAEDDSIKPSNESQPTKSTIGSLVSYFSMADVLKIGGSQK